MILISLGAWDYLSEIAAEKSVITAENELNQRRLDKFGAQLSHWLTMVARMLDFGHWDEYYPPYDVQLWTIPIEFRSSMLLFLVMLVAVRLQHRVRFVLFVSLALYSYGITRWVTVLFLVGAVIAETVVLYNGHENLNRTHTYNLIPPVILTPETNSGTCELEYEPEGNPPTRTCLPRIRPRIPRGAEISQMIYASIRVTTRLTFLLISLYLLSAPDYCIDRTP